MNVKELIKEIEGLNKVYGEKFYVSLDDVLDLVKKLDEPQKVTIPKFVADYIDFKKTYDFHVYGAMRTIEDYEDKRVPNWFYEGNIEKFCLAWLDGYEVEKEKRYLVKIKNMSKKMDCLAFKFGHIWVFRSSEENEEYRTRHTHKELEEAGFGWVFDCEGIEIEEVE